VLICVAAAGQIAATRDEDAEGQVDQLAARQVGRLHWLAGQLLADVTLILVASLADEAADHTGLGFVQLLRPA
jgi:putative exporter of polyketide antibiotics